MAEKKIRWTEQQKRAIAARGSDILVTASAGTGKTAVLSGRCVDIVSDRAICPDVWSILVLTFTDMAAEQMRSRIAGQLQDAFLESGDPHLRHQLVLLQGSDISTIHSFCKRLITEYFYKLGLDPTFRVIDGDEQKLLKAEVLGKTIDWAWQQSHLRAALEQLLYRRDLRTNDGFLTKIIDISDFLDGVVSRQNWYRRASTLAEAANPFTTNLGKKQKQIIAERLQHILNRLRHVQKLYENERLTAENADWNTRDEGRETRDEKKAIRPSSVAADSASSAVKEGKSRDGDWAEKLEDTHIRPVQQCLESLKADNWDKCSNTIRNFTKPKTSTPGELSEPVAKLLHDTAKDAIDAFKDLSQLTIVNPDYLDKLSGSAGLQTKVLVALIQKFDQLYRQAKHVVNCLDFADLEHCALELLTENVDDEDNLSPSQTALSLRQKYKYIFVDEYQDINPVQQAILKMLSSEGNVFVVGDVKQSIYAWRGAEPEIFLQRLKPASIDPANAPAGLRVDLNTNFRSDERILDFVNKIFARIMTAPFAKIDYDQSAHLKPAQVTRQRAQGRGHVVEFHILDEKIADSNSTEHTEKEKLNAESTQYETKVISTRQRQAAMIAQRIRQMVGADTSKAEFQVYDKHQALWRDVQYRDIVILMRSLAKKANDYVEVLRLAGVPVSCQATAGYFQTTEITDMLCLLKVLDNPQRDIELAAVLRSPFFNISNTELAKLKLHSDTGQNNKNFYDCVLWHCKCEQDVKLSGKLKGILAQIEQWQTIARRGNLADLIWQIYRQAGFLPFVSALPNGQSRRANLLKLHDRAIQFEGFATSTGIPSLTRFVEFIEKLQETGQDWSPAEPPEAAGNAVRILSVHKSKGLEFPVVFLAELESQFNKKDIYADCLADADNTLGLQIIDHQSNNKLPSLAHEVIAEQKLSALLAEEMRILYVATTRAKDRLILTASQKRTNCRQVISNGFFFGSDLIPGWQLRSCRSPLEWILYGLSDQKTLHNAFETGLAAKSLDGDLFSFKLHEQSELGQLSHYVRQIRDNKLTQPAHSACHDEAQDKSGLLRRMDKARELLSQVKKSLDWRYEFGDSLMLPAKQSVTALTHRGDEYMKFDYSRALDHLPIAVMTAEIGLTEPESRLIGTATHLVIAQLDLARPVTTETIEKIKEKLLTDGAITEVAAGHIDTESIFTFFQSELGRKVLDAWPAVRREWPFTFALPACEFAYSGDGRRATSDEIMVVQGIIDMLIQTPKGLLIIDFKTDNVTAEQVSQRAELYRQQLELYARAASAILNRKPLGKYLYFLRPACTIEIK